MVKAKRKNKEQIMTEISQEMALYLFNTANQHNAFNPQDDFEGFEDERVIVYKLYPNGEKIKIENSDDIYRSKKLTFAYCQDELDWEIKEISRTMALWLLKNDKPSLRLHWSGNESYNETEEEINEHDGIFGVEVE